ncbi:MAG: gene transfer agent family protein [Aestuariivirga sp.]|uniref:gene transfer agent family protein n=1 Tax=Aestuariivirga sp. TaxID=2650926 RepID=UPI0025C07936|nr:gene transfer agent family protein [Aestuariivirga sp.]MCA3561493.1 gene transfer agent family protein [Aestuariivirga sp.]
MANAHRGEIEAELSGRKYVLCLTLGALAELEHAYGGEDLIAIAQRFEAGKIGASDAIRVIGAGLRGAGNVVSDEQVADMRAEGGAQGFLSIVVRLLRATFAGET